MLSTDAHQVKNVKDCSEGRYEVSAKLLKTVDDNMFHAGQKLVCRIKSPGRGI